MEEINFFDVFTLIDCDIIPEEAEDIIIENNIEEMTQFITFCLKGVQYHILARYNEDGYMDSFHSDEVWEMHHSYREWYDSLKTE